MMLCRQCELERAEQGRLTSKEVPHHTSGLCEKHRRLAAMKTDIENWFTYHSPKGTQTDRYVLLREAGKALAEAIVAYTPSGPDQDAAIRKVREAVMTANAAIACGESDG